VIQLLSPTDPTPRLLSFHTIRLILGSAGVLARERTREVPNYPWVARASFWSLRSPALIGPPECGCIVNRMGRGGSLRNRNGWFAVTCPSATATRPNEAKCSCAGFILG